MPVSINNTQIVFNDATVQTTAAVTAPAANVQQFDSTGTWNKPANYNMARIQVWGGGGGGGRGGISSATGGGGGAYNEVTVPLSFLAASLTVTVGAGGLGRTGSNGAGTVGGTSSVPLATAVNGRTAVEAYGGGGGQDFYGGTGGGQLGAGITQASPNVFSGSPVFKTALSFDGTSGGESSLGGIWLGSYAGGNIWGGGAGAGATQAGSSLFGGGGGANNNPGGVAGVSVWGGSGGRATVGAVPGGGGGASASSGANGFNGGAGRVIITCW